MADPTSFLMSMLRRGAGPQPAAATAATTAGPQPPMSTNPFTSNAASAVAAAAAAGIPSSVKRDSLPQGRALPADSEIAYDIDDRRPGESQPQLEVTPITFVKSEVVLRHWQQIAVSDNFICYGLRQGHLRLLNRHDASRGLIRKHTAPLTDLRFFSRSSPLLLSCGSDSLVMVAKCCSTSEEVGSETLLHMKLKADGGDVDTAHVCWHPHSDDMLFLAVQSTLVLVSISGVGMSEEPTVCDISAPPRGTVVLPWHTVEAGIVSSDICITPNGKCIGCGLKDGRVVVFSLPPFTAPADFLQSVAATSAVHAVADTFSSSPVLSLHWLPPGDASSRSQHCSVLVAGDDPKVTLKLLHVGGHNSITTLQELKFMSSRGSKIFNQVAVEPHTRLVVVANTEGTALYTVHVEGDGLEARFDYLAGFSMSEPVLCLTSQFDAEAAAEGRSVVNLFAIQPKGIHQYSLDPAMTALPSTASTVQPPEPPAAAAPEPTTSVRSTDSDALPVLSPPVVKEATPVAEAAPPPVEVPSIAVSTSPEAASEEAAKADAAPTAEDDTGVLDVVTALVASSLKQAAEEDIAAPEPSALSSPLLTPVFATSAPSPTPQPPLPVLLAPNSPAFTQPASIPPIDAGGLDVTPGLFPVSSSAPSAPPLTQFVTPTPTPAGSRSQFEPPPPSAPPLPSRALSGEGPFLLLPTTLPMPMPTATAPPMPATELLSPVPTAAARVAQVPAADAVAPGAVPEVAETRMPAAPAPEVKVHPVAEMSATPEGGLRAAGARSSAELSEPESSMAAPEPKEVPEAVVVTAMASEVSTSTSKAVTPGAVDAVMKKLSQMEKNIKQAVTQSQQQLLKSVRSELSKQLQHSETTTSSQLARVMQAQMKTIEEERSALLRQHQADTDKLVAAVTQGVSTDLPLRMEDIVRNQVTAALSSLQPVVSAAVDKALHQALPKELSNVAVQGTLEKALASQLQSALAKPLQDSMRSSFQRQVIPALESAVATMFEQVQTTLTNGFTEHLQSHAAANTQLAESLKQAVAQVDSVSDRLKREVGEAVARLAGKDGASGRGSSSGMEVDAQVDPVTQITRLLGEKQYNAAFTAALMLNDVEKVTWLCGQLDTNTLFGNGTPLTQPVLLSLVQQLGFDLSKDASLKLQWIQAACMTLEPRDPALAPAVRSVLTQVYSKLQAFSQRASGMELQTVRLVMHVVNSMLHNAP